MTDKLKEELLTYAKMRAIDSRGTSYEWHWEDIDEGVFLHTLNECTKPYIDINKPHTWDWLIDWWESLPAY